VNLDGDTTSGQDVLVAADIAMCYAEVAGGDRIRADGPARPSPRLKPPAPMV
jgi:hypothetical protein